MQSGLLTFEDNNAVRAALDAFLARPPTLEEELQIVSLLEGMRGAIKDMQQPGNPDRTLSTDDFIGVVKAYSSGSRYFHRLKHLIEMTTTDLSAYSQLAESFGQRLSAKEVVHLQKINVLAGFFHDQEYVHVDGKISQAGERLLTQFVSLDAKGVYTIALDAPSDTAVRMVMDVFGFKEGDALSPNAGMNEFLSAVSAAKKLENSGLSRKDILSVVASIEATVPFKGENRMEELRARIETLVGDGSAFGIDPNDSTRVIDAIVANATLLANRDVMGLLGGITPGEDITVDHIRRVMEGTERMHLEEVPQLRVGVAGAYPPKALLTAVNKQYSLFAGILGEASSSRILHSVEIKSAGTHYPPQQEVAEYEKMGREVAKYMAVVMKSRVAATAIVSALAEEKGMSERHICDLLNRPFKLNTDAPMRNMTSQEAVAHELFSHVRHVGPHDTSRSLIAASLVQELGSEGLDQLVGSHPFTDSRVMSVVKGEEGAAKTFMEAARAVAGNIVDGVNDSFIAANIGGVASSSRGVVP